MFGKKTLNSDEFEALKKQITSLEMEIQKLKGLIDVVETNQVMLRKLFNKKILPDKPNNSGSNELSYGVGVLLPEQ